MLAGIKAIREVPVAVVTQDTRQRILCLGNAHNPLSVACLEALTKTGHERFVGVYDPLAQGPLRLVRTMFRERGWAFVALKATALIRAQLQLALSRAGFRLRRFGSLWGLCYASRLRILQCTNPNSAEFVTQVRSLGVDLIVVAAFSRILRAELIGVPRLGCVNVHPSLLPRYRGPNPFYWVLANQDAKTGVTVHRIDEGIDSGPILLQREFDILQGDTEHTLQTRSAGLAAKLVVEAVALLASGTAQWIPQDNSAASYYPLPPRGKSVL